MTRTIAFALAAILAACSPGEVGVGVSQETAPTVEPSRRPGRSPLPLPSPTKGEVEPRATEGGYIYVARSRGITWGQPYRFSLYTHCGIGTPPVDFDGTFWDVAFADARRFLHRVGSDTRYEKETVRGNMTVIGDGDVAVFRSTTGHSLRFERAGATIEAGVCF